MLHEQEPWNIPVQASSGAFKLVLLHLEGHMLCGSIYAVLFTKNTAVSRRYMNKMWFSFLLCIPWACAYSRWGLAPSLPWEIKRSADFFFFWHAYFAPILVKYTMWGIPISFFWSYRKKNRKSDWVLFLSELQDTAHIRIYKNWKVHDELTCHQHQMTRCSAIGS